jgi:hypothetical protein
MGGGDVSQLEYDTILELCRKYSRGTSKNRQEDQEIYWQEMDKTGRGGVTREEIIEHARILQELYT